MLYHHELTKIPGLCFIQANFHFTDFTLWLFFLKSFSGARLGGGGGGGGAGVGRHGIRSCHCGTAGTEYG